MTEAELTAGRRAIARATAQLLRDLADACDAIAEGETDAADAETISALRLLRHYTDTSAGRISVGDSECNPALLVADEVRG